jgi:hypothetical protein
MASMKTNRGQLRQTMDSPMHMSAAMQSNEALSSNERIPSDHCNVRNVISGHGMFGLFLKVGAGRRAAAATVHVSCSRAAVRL